MIPLLASVMIIFVTVVKLLGMDILVRFNFLIALMSMLPCLIFVLYGANRMNPDDWVSMETSEEGIDWALLLSWEIWLYSGFFGIGALTAEIENAHKTIIKVVIVLLPMLILINCLPLMVGMGIDDNLENYSAGYFDTLGEKLAGKWLGVLFTIGSQVCMVGLYNTQTLICERSVTSFVISRIGCVSFVYLFSVQ
jgi:amino acid transporter